MPRQLVGLCYDHLSGILGEMLTQRLIELGWITPEPTPGITPAGWAGLTALGIDLAPLASRQRKPVAICVERRQGEAFDHLGAHLGALIARRFRQAGWLRANGDQLEVTPAGQAVLRQLGIDLEA